jgi:chromosome segregation ATPase
MRPFWLFMALGILAGCASTKQVEDTIARLQNEITRLRRQLQQQVQPLPIPGDQFDRVLYVQMLNDLQEEKASLERELAALQKLRSTVDALQAALIRLEGEKMSLEHGNRALQTDLARLGDEKASLERKVKAAEEAIRELNSQIIALDVQVYLLRTETR